MTTSRRGRELSSLVAEQRPQVWETVPEDRRMDPSRASVGEQSKKESGVIMNGLKVN